MSARILYSLTDDRSRGSRKQPVGCMNGIFHLFNRVHFLSAGRRPAGISPKTLAAGQDVVCGAEEDVMSIRSSGEVSKTLAKERRRLSTDSSRSSASSPCYSSSFSSSIEDHGVAKMDPPPIGPSSMEQRANDLPRLRRGSNLMMKSGGMASADSPRPVFPSKVARERNSNSSASPSLRDFPSLQRPRNFADSPRFSYDGRESRDAIKSNVTKLKEQARHSLDSKWRSSVVAKLMGLEPATNVQPQSGPRIGHGRNNSVDAANPFSVSSRKDTEYNHESRADLVVRVKSTSSQVPERVPPLTPEGTPLQSPSLSVYGDLVKRLEQIEFKRSGKEFRALKQVLEAMQKSERIYDARKKIQHVVTQTNNVDRSGFVAKFADRSSRKPACSENHRGTQRYSCHQQRSDALPLRSSSRYAHYTNRGSELTNTRDEHRRAVESDSKGRNFGNSRAGLQLKRPELTDSPRRFNQPERLRREPRSPRRTPKSKVIGNPSNLNERRNLVSKQSDDDASLASRDDDSEVSSYQVTQDELTPKKVILPSKVNGHSSLDFGIIQEEQPSPVSVLNLTHLEDDEFLSPAKMMSKDFKEGKSTRFFGQDQGLHASSQTLPDKKHEHTYILQTPDAGSLMTIQLRPSGNIMTNLFPMLEPNNQGNNLLMGEPQPKCSERIQRKLLLDVIDEIMVQKLVSNNNNKNRFLPCSPSAKKTGHEQLLQGLCSEIANLQADTFKWGADDDEGDYIKAILRRDMEREAWSCNGHLDDSGVVLDVERLIFKDLVTEVVTGEAMVLRNSLASSCRPIALG
ncbi:hypothetical protein MLD38_001520 [Melastoma candidum]|uniref:Uncharacterized protein n=1 Tax=Melastoma candidum TaxID=119954 RepID=A0ACB9SDL7_9MYRT|nr:hypothetical protein MLD38_001520 [Melastoma candidum]